MFAGPLFEEDGFPEADEAEGATWLEFAELELAWLAPPGADAAAGPPELEMAAELEADLGSEDPLLVPPPPPLPEKSRSASKSNGDRPGIQSIPFAIILEYWLDNSGHIAADAASRALGSLLELSNERSESVTTTHLDAWPIFVYRLRQVHLGLRYMTRRAS